MTSAPTEADVAQWMLEYVRQNSWLYQDDAAWKIQSKFGRGCVYDNDNGNPAISKAVLKAFNTLTKDSIVWSRDERAWRLRKPSDKAGRQQD